jgi:hypothetical protein
VKRRYWIIIILLLLGGLDWVIRAPDSRSRQLTAVIAAQGSAKLKSYPYQFRILKVTGETAFISTPRNVQVPAFKGAGRSLSGNQYQGCQRSGVHRRANAAWRSTG